MIVTELLSSSLSVTGIFSLAQVEGRRNVSSAPVSKRAYKVESAFVLDGPTSQ